MADRMQYQAPSIYSNTSPQMQVDDGTADLLKTQATVFLNNANEAHKRQLQSDLDMAKEEGQRLGYNMGADFRPMKGQSLFSRQFNESGLYTAGQKISMQTQRKVRDLSKQFPANPESLGKALEGWREGFVGDLPEEMQTTFSMNYDQIAIAAMDQAVAQRQEITSQQAAAQFYEFEREITNTVEEIAPVSFRQGPEGDSSRKAIATLRQNFMETLVGNGPEGAYQVAGYDVKAQPGRSGAFTPLEIQKKMDAFDKMVIEAGVFGNFQDEVKAGRGVDAYMQFVKGDIEVSSLDEAALTSRGMSSKKTPLSVRNNNPGNIREGSDGFKSYPTPEAGLNAMKKDLLVKVSGRSDAMKGRFGANYAPTLANVISTWAPPSENDTNNYIRTVSRSAGIPKDKVLTEADVDKIMPAMVKMEGGKAAADYFYGDGTAQEFQVEGMTSVRISDILSNDEMESLASKMRTFIGGINSMEEGEYKKQERNRERYNDDYLRMAYSSALQVQDNPDGSKTVIGGDPVALQTAIGHAINDPMIEVGTIDKLQALAKDIGSGHVDNPMIVGDTWEGISTGVISDYRSIPSQGVSDQTRLQMYNAIDQRNKGQHWTNSNRYRIAQDYADAVLAPEKSAGFSLLGDPNSQSAADRAEWNKLMIQEVLSAEAAGTLPQNPNAIPAQGEFDFVARGREIADQIAAKRNKPDNPKIIEIDNEIDAIEQQMNNPKKGDNVEEIKQRYRELQERRNALQTRQMMGLE